MIPRLTKSLMARRRVAAASLLLGCLLPAYALDATGVLEQAGGRLTEAAGEGWRLAKGLLNSPKAVPASGTIEVAFSPDMGAEELVLKTTDSAKADLRVMAYSFTSARVTAAMVRAAKRGVKVYVLADEKHNVGQGAGPKARAALSAMSLAGVQVRLVGAYAIFHDKVQIVDGRTVQTGSFNYSEAAAKRNSENVIVHWGNAELAVAYADHFARNWQLSKPFTPDY